MRSFLLAACLLTLPLLAYSQDVVGTWKTMVAGPDGEMMAMHSVVKPDGTFQLDMGGDGQFEMNGIYEMDDDQVTFWTTDGECNAKGVYNWAVTGNTMTMTRISDGCEGRGGPEGKIVYQRL